MKILIIDNNSRHKNQLIELARDQGCNSVTLMGFGEINLAKISEFDLIILSGGHGDPIINHDDEYAFEIELIKLAKKPILGICLGCELIAHTFKSTLELLKERETSELDLELLEETPFTQIFSKIKVHEGHRWYIKTLGSTLKALAKSKDGIEIIQHKIKPIYGVQFHPELDPSAGRNLIHYLLSL